MRGKEKTKEEMSLALSELRQRISDLEKHETEFQRVKEELKKSEEKYRMAFEWTGTAMMVLDEDTMISMVNHKATLFRKLNQLGIR